MKLDLHMHTNASDGAWPPEKLVRAARHGGLDVIAVADHDTTAGVAAAIAAAGPDLTVVPASELTCADDDGDLHLLGYGIDPDHAALRRHVAEIARLREERMLGMIERLDGLEVRIAMEDVRREAGDDAVLGRPHLARALVAAGYVGHVGEAFERYIADHGTAWVPVRSVRVEDAIGLVHDAGGLAVWAHPPLDRLEAGLPALVEAGLDGVECHRPRASGREVELARNAAAAHDLLVSGGSDWHGPWSGRVGDFSVRREDVAALAQALGIEASA